MRRQGAVQAEVERPGDSPTATVPAPYGVSGATLFVLAILVFSWGCQAIALAGGPDPAQYPNMKQQWVQDVVQTAKEQNIPKADILKQLVIAFAEEIGWGKALLWIAMFPLLTIVAFIVGLMKLFKRKA